ncbi:MAG: hypothetical protein P9X24_02365 [Candidatus Hatepunaea meridiana]|nr:hypothetical protein [Candidatus Hatepunaea meridiana]
MKQPRRVTAVALSLAFVAMLLMSVGCTKYASPDDLQQLEGARKAAVSAEKCVDDIKAERQDVKRELDKKEADLKNAQQELDYAKAHIGDYTMPSAEEETNE